MTESLNLFITKVYEHCGLNYFNNVNSLQFKMDKHLQKLNFNDYAEYLLYIENHPLEWDTIVEILTINETYFYREEKQFIALMNNVLRTEQFMANNTIKLWSAACSTGEEPYSILMNGLDQQFDINRMQIMATDINQQVLATAQNGKYYEKSLAFRRIPQRWLSNYFESENNYLHVKDWIKNQIEFTYLNLIEYATYPAKQSMDVIFCRNVLIYFDDETIEKILNAFYETLAPGGYLFLGHSEMISRFKTKFITINDQGTFYYKKGTEDVL